MRRRHLHGQLAKLAATCERQGVLRERRSSLRQDAAWRGIRKRFETSTERSGAYVYDAVIDRDAMQKALVEPANKYLVTCQAA